MLSQLLSSDHVFGKKFYCNKIFKGLKMKILMNPKIVFTVIAILNIIHGLLLLFGAESMYMGMGPGLSQEGLR